MKRIIVLFLLGFLSINLFSQVTGTDIEIRKVTPQLKLNGTGAFINFYNGDILLTQSSNVLTLSGGDFALGSNNIRIMGSIGTTSERSAKGWFTNIETTNTPTIGGTPISSIYAPLNNPLFTGSYIRIGSDTSATRAYARSFGGGGGTWGSIIGTLSNQTDLQSALDAKSPTNSPTFTTSATLPTATSIGNVSSTELSYLDNATSNIQAQLNDTTTLALAINAQTGTTYTLALTDSYKLVTMSNAAEQTLTVPPNTSVAFPIGVQITVCQVGTAETNIAQGSGVTINSADGDKALRVQYSSATLIKTATDTWLLIGDIEP